MLVRFRHYEEQIARLLIDNIKKLISLYISPAYIRAAAALCVVCLLADVAATILTGLGLRSQDHRDKHKYYRFAVFCMGIACELWVHKSFRITLIIIIDEKL